MSPVEVGGAGKPAVTKPAEKPKEKKPTRQERKTKIVSEGKPFSYVGKRTGKFSCICGAVGKHAIVLKDKNGKEVLVGGTCLAETGVQIPKEPKPASGAAAKAEDSK